MLKRFVIVAGLVLAVLGVPSGGASADVPVAQTTLDTCMRGGEINSRYWLAPDQQYSDFRVDGSCHVFFGLRTDATPTKFSGTASYPGKLNAGFSISSISFDVSGGNGSDGGLTQAIKVCSQGLELCSEPISALSANDIIPKHYSLSLADGTLKPGADRVALVGNCKIWPNCGPARALEISNMKIALQDQWKPTITWDSDYLGDFSNLVPGAWNAGQHEMPVVAFDVGTGIKRVVYVLNGGQYPHETPDCGSVNDEPLIPVPCPGAWDFEHHVSFGSNIGIFAKPGVNTASIIAIDAAGNQSDPLAFNFKIDQLSPQVSFLKATSVNPYGWQADNALKLAWTNAPENLETATQSGVVSATYDISPLFAGGADPPEKPVPGVGIQSIDGISLPGPGLWKVTLKTTDKVGLSGSPQTVTVGVDPTVPAGPAVAAQPKLSGPDLAAGVDLTWSPPSNIADVKSGICNYTMSVDRNQHADPGTAGGILGTSLSTKLPPFLPDGVSYVHLRAVSCSGVGGQITDKAIAVDSLAPEIAFSSPGTDGWYSQDHPLSASLVLPDEAGAQMSVSVDGVAEAPAPTTHLDIPLLDGEHSVVVTATDSLGNQSSRAATVKADVSSPKVRFAAFDPAHPTFIRATVDDQFSGVRDAYLQYRFSAGGEWQSLSGLVHATGGSRPELELNAKLPDLDLEPGAYDLRAVAFDVAGDVTAGGVRIDGSPAVLNLPLRKHPSLTASFSGAVAAAKCKRGDARSTACKARRKKQPQRVVGQSTVVAFGETVAVGGVLHSASGEPAANAQLEVFETVIGSGKRKVATIVTDAAGKYSFHPQPGPSRRITVRWAGSDVELPVETSVDFFARSQVTLTVSRHRAPGGSIVTFSGHLSAPGAIFPRSGKEIKFQQWIGGVWRNFVLESAVGPDGDFRAAYKTGAVKDPLRLKIRAKAAGADGWAYEAGFSRTVTLVVY